MQNDEKSLGVGEQRFLISGAYYSRVGPRQERVNLATT